MVLVVYVKCDYFESAMRRQWPSAIVVAVERIIARQSFRASHYQRVNLWPFHSGVTARRSQ